MKPIRVMGFGTFDGVHPGHLAYLKQLKALGDELFIVVARDQNVMKIKGHAPRLNEENRKNAIKATGLSDETVLGDLEDFYKVLHAFQPDIIGLGYDQKADTDEIAKRFPGIKIIRLDPFEPDRYKSSLAKG